jgi:acyltransferase
MAALDAVRVVGIAAIVAGHVWSTGIPAHLVYAWHVPVFFFLTGWLWRGGRTLAEETASRVRTLLVPYAAWLVVIGIPYLIVLAHEDGPVVGELKHLAYGGRYLVRPFTAFWFVTALFALCLLRRALGRLSLPVVTAVAVALWGLSYPVAGALSKAPESIGMALPALVFLVGGEWARIVAPRLPARAVLGPVLVVAPLVAVAVGAVRAVNLKIGDLGTPVAGYVVALAVSLGLVITAQELERHVPARLAPGAVALASVGLTVILSHAVLLSLLATPASGRWSDFAITLVVPWVIALVIRRTPAARVLVAWPNPARAITTRRSRAAPVRQRWGWPAGVEMGRERTAVSGAGRAASRRSGRAALMRRRCRRQGPRAAGGTR